MKKAKQFLSLMLAASLIATLNGTQAFADTFSEDIIPEPDMITAVYSEPSEYGYSHVTFVNENGDPVEFDRIPDTTVERGTLPSSYDLRDYDRVSTSVKYQGTTGTCWAHAAMACSESNLIVTGTGNTSTDLSEAHLVWFSQGAPNTNPNDPLYGDGSEEDTQGTACYIPGGGNDYTAVQALAAGIGYANESRFADIKDQPEIDESYRYISDYRLVRSEIYDADDTDSIKASLMQHGALSFSYFSDDTAYKYSDAGYTHYQNAKTTSNHAVTLVGWDDNFSKSNFVTEPEGDGAWLLKNSWGSYWGDQGYFWLSYYDTSIQEVNSYELVKDSGYSGIYQYDSTFYSTYGYYSAYTSAANIFTATSNDPITAVSVHTTAASVPYTIRIYTGTTYGNDPISGGTLVHTQSGTLTYSGFHTLPLTSPVNITTGTNFTVVITLEKNDAFFVFDDYASNANTSFLTISSGSDSPVAQGYTWMNMSSQYNSNVAIKAYTSAGKPTNVKATAGDGQVTLTWDAITGAERYAVSIYNASTNRYVLQSSQIKSTSYTVTGLTNGTKYPFLVQVYMNGKWSTYSSADLVYATPISTKPTGIKATAGDGQVTLTWNSVTGATRYAVSIHNASTNRYVLQSSQITSTSYTVTGLTNGTEYPFLVQAYVNGKWSSYSTADLVCATPASTKPTGIKATAGDGSVKLTWNSVTGATRYAVSIHNASTNRYVLQSSQITSTSYTVTGLTNGTKYPFLVQAYVNGKWSAASTADLVYATPASTKPTGIKASTGNGAVTLNWTAVAGATRYAVSIHNASTNRYVLQSSQITSTSYTVTGLTNGTKYPFLVQAYVNGKWSTASTADLVYATPNSTKPADIKATAGNGKVTLSWTAVTGATRYAVSVHDASASRYVLKSSQITSTSYTVTGLTNGTKYPFLVQAYVNGKWSAASTADLVYATPKA